MADPGRLVGVELFEDRAAVTREVGLSAGRHALRLGPWTPLLSERSLSFPGGTGVVVEEARVERVWTTRVAADPAEVAALEARWREARAAAEDARDEAARAGERVWRAHQLVEAALNATPRALCEDAAPEAWFEQVQALIGRSTAARREQAVAERGAARADERRDQLAADLAAARVGRPVVEGWLCLSVLASTDGPLQVRYTVPCAVWRPAHRAELDGDLVRWEVRAVCWNATGEDWSGAALTCSTARPGDLAEPPALLDDVVSARRRAPEVVVEARDESVQVARERGARRAVEVPGVDDGGEPRTWRAEGPVDLPSDGRPVVVALESWSAEASARWLALPERAAVAVRRTVQRNLGSRPLLAGPVELVSGGVAIGRGRIDLVPPGEPFPLGWGSHDGLRLVRRVDQEAKTATFTGRQSRVTKVTVVVHHLGDTACRLEVCERVPTSELKELTVSAPRAEPALDAPMDRDGFCRWSLELAPGDRRELTLEFTLDAAAHLVLPG